LKIRCTSTPGRAMYQWMLQLLLGKLFLSLSPSTGCLYFRFINNSVSWHYLTNHIVLTWIVATEQHSVAGCLPVNCS
jgi:hypothetical protein